MINYNAEIYVGSMVGRHNCRMGVQIVATDSETGKRKYVFEQYNGYRQYKTPTLKIWEGVAHYKTGFNAKDNRKLLEMLEIAEEEAKRLNAEQPDHNFRSYV